MAIIQETVEIKVSGKNYHHWKNLGYPVDTVKGHGRGNKEGHATITVKTSELPKGSRTYVVCRCDQCGKEYRQKILNNTDRCRNCRQVERNAGNKYGTAHKGRIWEQWKGKNNPVHAQDKRGEKHHNWNPLKTEFAAYKYMVQQLTEANYRLFKDRINPNDLPRRLNGTEGGYQLDHMISIKNGFRGGLPPEKIAAPENLQMLPWSTNRTKWDR